MKLYIEIKKHEVGFGMYPLCIDTSNKSDEEIQNFDATTGAIVCVEGGKSDAKALTIVESKIGDSYYICCGRCGQEGHNIRTCTFFPKNS